MAIADIFADTDRRFAGYRESSRLTVIKAAVMRGDASGDAGYASGPAGVYSAVNQPNGGLTGRENMDALRQYRAAGKDIPFTAIRPICTKIAAQAIKVGVKKEAAKTKFPKIGGGKPSPASRTNSRGPKSSTSLSLSSLLSDPAVALTYKNSPAYIRKAISEGLEPLDNHELLPAFENPNPYMTGWALKFCTVFSICATGQAYWWIQKLDSELDDGQASVRFWYMPAHWMTPVHLPGQPFARWRVRPPGVAESDSWTVDNSEIAYFMFPNPEDPTRPMSPIQTQARAINTDDEVQKAQFAGMVNGGKPGLVLTAGRLDNPPGVTGQGPRPVLTPEQRKQLISACRMAYSGAMHYGDPFIVDGLIEAVTPFTRTPAELDFVGGSKLTKDRIMQGIGTNPIVAGQVEGANRASSYVAQEIFYSNVVNPIITLISQLITQSIAPIFKGIGEELHIWIEEAKAFDADLQLSQMNLLCEAGAVRKNEVREAFDLAPLDESEGGNDLVDLKPEPPMPPGGPGGATKVQNAGSAKKKPAGKKKGLPRLTTKYNNGPRRVTGQWSGGIVDAADAIARISASPQFAARDDFDPQAHADAWGIAGDFHQMQLPAILLGKMLDRGTLNVSSKLSEETIVAKVDGADGEKINPTIIVYAAGPGGAPGREKLYVADGTHSLMARIRQAIAAGEEGPGVMVDCMVSAAAMEKMMLS